MQQIFKFKSFLFAVGFAFSAYAQEGIDPKLGLDANPNNLNAQKSAIKITNTKVEPAINSPSIDTITPNRKTERTEINEFQAFIQYATGKTLPIFGSDFFANAPSTFAPIQNVPVPSEYLLGAGDEILIRAWGSIDVDYRATIDRNGVIAIPTLGTVPLAGVKADDAEGVIKSAVARQYRDVTVSVSFGRLRSITVYVVGQALKPGSYTISGFSTLVTALLVSGGPNGNGSMRNVQVKRSGKVIGILDLYTFIAKGDKSNDVKLLDGDTIFIPPALAHIALNGKVNTPAIFELRSHSETVASILELAGGLPVVADPRRVFLERIEVNKQQPRSIEEFALDQAGLKKTLKNGDLLTFGSVTPDFSNAITLRGNVDQALRVPFTSGMRIKDLIPNKETLITRSSVQRQNNALNKKTKNTESIAASIGDLIDDVNWEYAVIERIDRNTLNVNLIAFNLGNVMSDANSPDNLPLQAGDTITIFSQNEIKVPISKRKVFARIEGEVNVPGVYQMQPNDTLATLIAKAGGTTSNAYIYGTEFYRERVRQEQQVNLEKVQKRLESQMRIGLSKSVANTTNAAGEAQLSEAKLKYEQDRTNETIKQLRELKANGRIVLDVSHTDQTHNKLPVLKLENGDHLHIPSRSDFVHVYGAVNQESSLIWRTGLTVEKYLAESGPTEEADIDGVFVLRANGTVLSTAGRSWFSSVTSVELMPGDSIVVPEKFNKESAYNQFIRGMKDWAQIFSGFGLGAAAIKSLK